MKSLLILGLFAGFANAQTVGDAVNILPSPAVDAGSWKTTSASRSVVVQATDAVLPVLLNGDGMRSIIRMVNLENSTADYMINFMDKDGAAMAFPLEGRQAATALRGTIPANAVLELKSTGRGPTVSGWAIALSTSARISTSVTLQDLAADRELRSSTHHASNASVKKMRASFDNTNGTVTKVVFSNVNVTGPTPLTVIVRDTTGAELGRASYVMAAWGQYNIGATDVTASAEGRSGTIEFSIPQSSEFGIGGVSIRITPTGFDLLDVMALTSWAN